jgi:putative endonuclease
MTHLRLTSQAAARQQLARQGEAIAAQHLASLGQTILARNERTPYGEMDLITKQGDCTIIVEVKTRTSRQYGLPEEAVDARKRNHLLHAATFYLQREGLLETPWRIDVVSIEIDKTGKMQRLEVFEHAVRDE